MYAPTYSADRPPIVVWILKNDISIGDDNVESPLPMQGFIQTKIRAGLLDALFSSDTCIATGSSFEINSDFTGESVKVTSLFE